MTSTTTGYYGCHPIFVPIPCIHNIIHAVVHWLNPFNWIQIAQNKTGATAIRVIRSSLSTKEDPEPPEPGDSVYFGCPEGNTVTGNANGARGFSLLLMENMEWSPPPPEPGCFPITYSISGDVVDAFNGLKIADAKVTISVEGEEQSVTTNEGGQYVFENIKFGTWTLKATKSGEDSAHKTIDVNTDIVPGTTATLYLARPPKSTEWIAVVAHPFPGEPVDSYTKFGPTTTYFGNKYSAFGGTTAIMLQGGLDDFVAKYVHTPDGTKTEATLIDLGEAVNYENDDVKFMVNAADIEGSQAKIYLLKGSEIIKELKVGECEGSTQDGWWHAFTLSATGNNMKWDCHNGGDEGEAAFLQDASKPHFSRRPRHEEDIDFASYVGPFPGRFWRHHRRHRNHNISMAQYKQKLNTNNTGTSSFLKHRGEASPSMLKVGASDVDVKSTA